VNESVRNFLPVIEAAPESPAAKSLLAVSAAAEHLMTVCAGGATTREERGAETETGSPRSATDLALHVFTTHAWTPRTPALGRDSNRADRSETVPTPGEIVT
jgi:hypothetical protein